MNTYHTTTSLSADVIFASLPTAQHYWLALSGGLDSVVLLHLFNAFAKEKILNFTAVYIHHGWSVHASEWQAFCQQICQQWQVPFQSHTVNAAALSGESREEKARQARYAALGNLLAPGDCVLTAHHQNDQAETLLLQLFRGAGVKGLAAIPALQTFAKGILYRPLLSYTRPLLAAYAKTHDLKWVEDDSNKDLTLQRNYIRHHLLPPIEHAWSGAVTTLSRSARLCAEADELLSELASLDWQQVADSHSQTLVISKLKQLSPVRQRNLLRYWLQMLKFRLPSERKLIQLQEEVIHAKSDARPLLTWTGGEIRRYRDHLHAMSPLAKASVTTLHCTWNLHEQLPLLPLGITLSAKLVKGQGLYIANAQPPLVDVRFRQGGEKIALPKRSGHHTLKKLFQEWNIPPWQRDKIPLIYIKNELVCIVGYAIHANFLANTEQEGWEITL